MSLLIIKIIFQTGFRNIGVRIAVLEKKNAKFDIFKITGPLAIIFLWKHQQPFKSDQVNRKTQKNSLLKWNSAYLFDLTVSHLRQIGLVSKMHQNTTVTPIFDVFDYLILKR